MHTQHSPYVGIIFGGLVACLAGVPKERCPTAGGVMASEDASDGVLVGVRLFRTGTGGGLPGLEVVGVVDPTGEPEM